MTQSIEYHTNKATLILDNTYELYEREQAIFKLHMLHGQHDSFTRRLVKLAGDVVAKTNLLETSDEHMNGEVFDKVQAQVYAYMVDDYHTEFVKWNEVENGQIVNTI